jgi:hypothetical protein
MPLEAFDCAAGTAQCAAPVQRDARNRLQDLLLRASAHNCDNHKGAIYGNAAWASTLGNVIAVGLAGSAAIVGGFAGQALAAGAGFATATGQIIEKNIYQTYLAPAIIAEIDAARTTGYAQIQAKRSSPPRSIPSIRRSSTSSTSTIPVLSTKGFHRW